jgi:hypothetical protein
MANDERQQNTATYPIAFLMVDATDKSTPEEGLVPTVTISKNNGAFAPAAGAVTEIGNGWYSLAGNATDRDTLGELIIHAEAAGADKVDKKFTVVGYDPFAVATTNAQGRVDAQVKGMDTNTISATTFANNAIGGLTIATDAVTKIQQGLATTAGANANTSTIVTAIAGIDIDTSEFATKVQADNILAALPESFAYSFTDTVINSQTGDPVAGAAVYLFNNADCTGDPLEGSDVTNALGSFTVRSNASGAHWVRISGAGIQTEINAVTLA